MQLNALGPSHLMNCINLSKSIKFATVKVIVDRSYAAHSPNMEPKMTIQYNPFYFLTEGLNHFKDARILRSSFFQRIWDAFAIFYGSSLFLSIENGMRDINPNIERRLGLFDYATFFLFLGFDLLFEWYKNNCPDDASVIRQVGYFLITGVNILLNSIRFLVSGLVTALALPFIAITHFLILTGLNANTLQENALAIPIEKTNLQFEFTHEHTLKNLLNDNSYIDIEDLTAKKVTIYAPETGCRLILKNKHASSPQVEIMTPILTPKECSPLIALNMFGVTRMLENGEQPSYEFIDKCQTILATSGESVYGC